MLGEDEKFDYVYVIVTYVNDIQLTTKLKIYIVGGWSNAI